MVRGGQGENYFDAKTVPISHVNKNKIHKNNDFMTLLAIESIENTINNAIEVL